MRNSHELAFDNPPTALFSTDYGNARTLFRRLAKASGGRLSALPLGAAGPRGESLHIDLASFGPTRPHSIVLHMSGVHGVEGFAGSAIQARLLERRLTADLPPGVGVVLVHGVNPFGMAWLRRVNSRNVDLNRNALPPGEDYATHAGLYERLDQFLNPRGPCRPGFFLAQLTLLLLRHGYGTLEQTIAGGQYEFPQGLYYGGDELQEELSLLADYLASEHRAVRQLVSIDVHTGIGPFAHEALFPDVALVGSGRDLLRQIVGLRADVKDPHFESTYSVRGGLENALKAALPETTVVHLIEEFGTYLQPSILDALRNENAFHHHGPAPDDVAHPIKQRLRTVFCPEHEGWRRSVLFKGRALFQTALRAFARD